ncbi:hypothetical protein [Empedobacter sedimenti]|uniref:hypothetical protein n=1 Tax=Empedobacter sedimenti TaxID=3042610 RepID=UPI0024A6C34F|nr:hypothetical protein [Empedobacter sedimenti]
MRKFYVLILILLGILSFAQTQSSDFVQVNGVYLDTDGFPMTDYEVKVFDSKISTITDNEGKFSLNVPKEIKHRVYLEYVDFNKVRYIKKVDDFDKVMMLKMYDNPSVKKYYVSTSDGPISFNFKKETLIKKLGQTISWPFRQIGKIF